MSDLRLPQPRPGIMDITPYAGGESKLAGVETVIKLSSNEGALGASPKAREALARASMDIHRYPDGGCGALREAIGKRMGLDPARIVCGAGSDELIGLLCKAYAGPGDTIVQTRHGFLMYAIYAKAAGVETLFAPETGLRADVDAILETVQPSTRIVFIANPNNPTGTYISADELKRLREGLRDDIILAIDAAYSEFVTRNDYTDGQMLVDSHPNTVMLRTFSKIHGLGGVRLGWCYAPAHIVDVLNRVRSPFNVSGPAQAAGAAAIADIAFTDLAVAHNTVWLEWTQERLRALGLQVTDSVGNFALATFTNPDGPSAAEADTFLRAHGIIVRRVGGYGLPDSLRISIGRDTEMTACAEALAAFLATEGAS